MSERKFSNFIPKVEHIYREQPITLVQLIQKITEDFLSTPLTSRLEKLAALLEHKDADLSRHVRNIKTEFDKNDWGVATTSDGRPECERF